MRALILRRAQMVQDGIGGPVIVGRAENADVLRLEHFLARNGTPRMTLDPETDPEAKALIERSTLSPGNCRSSYVQRERCSATRATMSLRAASDC